MRIDFREIQEVRLPGMNHGVNVNEKVSQALMNF